HAVMLTGKDYYEKFLDKRSGDPSLMAELAWSHYQLAEITLRQARDRLRSTPIPRPPSVPPASTDDILPRQVKLSRTPGRLTRRDGSGEPPYSPKLPAGVIPPPPLVPPGSTDDSPQEPRVPDPSWDADLTEAARNNNEALSLYRQLVEHHHAPKEREY